MKHRLVKITYGTECVWKIQEWVGPFTVFGITLIKGKWETAIKSGSYNVDFHVYSTEERAIDAYERYKMGKPPVKVEVIDGN